MINSSSVNSQVRRAPQSAGNLYEVLDLILDKGIVVDAFVRVSLVGIELLTVDLRVVIASVDTYLQYAEAVDRLDLSDRSDSATLPDAMEGQGEDQAKSQGANRAKEAVSGDGKSSRSKGGAQGLLGTVVDKIKDVVVGTDDSDEQGKAGGHAANGKASRRPARASASRGGGRAAQGSRSRGHSKAAK